MSEDDSMPPVEDPAYASMCEERACVRPGYLCSECHQVFETEIDACEHDCKARTARPQRRSMSEERQSVTGAAFMALRTIFALAIDYSRMEYDCKKAGVMIATVEEWDARGQSGEDWKEVARLNCQKVDVWRERAMEAEAKLASLGGYCERVCNRAMDLEAKLAAAEEFTRQYADSVIAQPSAAPHNKSASLLKMTEPTHKLGGDRSR